MKLVTFAKLEKHNKYNQVQDHKQNYSDAKINIVGK